MMRNMMTLSSLNFSVVSFISLKLYSNLVVMKQMSQQVDYIINQNVLFDNRLIMIWNPATGRCDFNNWFVNFAMF